LFKASEADDDDDIDGDDDGDGDDDAAVEEDVPEKKLEAISFKPKVVFEHALLSSSSVSLSAP